MYLYGANWRVRVGSLYGPDHGGGQAIALKGRGVELDFYALFGAADDVHPADTVDLLEAWNDLVPGV